MEELLKKAAVIRDETEDNLNTSWRVGTLFVDVIQEMQNVSSKSTILINTLKFTADKEAVKLSFDIKDDSGNVTTKVLSVPMVSKASAGVLAPEQLATIQSDITDLLNRIQGTSEKSNALSDPFLNLGTFTSLSELKAKLDSLYKNEDVGYYRFVLAYEYRFQKIVSELHVEKWSSSFVFQSFTSCVLVDSMNDPTVELVSGGPVHILSRRGFFSEGIISWDKWIDMQDVLANRITAITPVVISESEYNALIESGEIDNNTYYDIYEDE